MHSVTDPDAITDVTGTAFVVAEFRAEENQAEHPLYRDDVVPLLLGAGSRQAAARVATGFPLVRELIKIRTRYFDDMLDRQLAAGCRQVVLLGAGLDTRAVRKSAAGVRFFEIDDASTMRFKQGRLAQHGLHADTAFIEGDYVTDGMLPLLVGHGLDLQQPTYVIWEGNTMYLEEAVDRAILVQLREGLPRVRVSFDYFLPSVITRTSGDAGMTRLADDFARMNAPWVTGFGDVHALADGVGLRVLEDVTTAALSRAYRRTSVVPPFGPFYSIATLGSF